MRVGYRNRQAGVTCARRTCTAALAALAVAAVAVALVACSGRFEEPQTTRERPGHQTRNALYVSTEGTDSAPGTYERPLGSIGTAARKAKPGFMVYVREGTYRERPAFDASGTASEPITFLPYRDEKVVVSEGFVVSGDYNRVLRFTVTPGTREPAPAQIEVSGDHNVLHEITQRKTYGDADRFWPSLVVSGNENVIRRVDFSDCGTLVISGGQGNVVRGGTVHHTGGLIALVDEADDTTFEGLDLHDPGQVDRSGNGADAINFNARRFTIRRCLIHGVFTQDPDQHTDAIQWWNTGDDFVLERSVIGSRRSGGALGERDHGQLQFESSTPGKTSHRVIIRNNVFLGTQGPFVIRGSLEQTIRGQADDWLIAGNTFYDAKEIRGSMLANMRRMRIMNNVFFGANRLAKGEGSVYDYNAYVGVPVNATDGPNSMYVADPRFAKPDVSKASAFGMRADFSLAEGSPLKGAGRALAELRRDLTGEKRANPPAIGAFE